MVRDSEINIHLMHEGLLADKELVAEINDILAKPRYLDSVPKPIQLQSNSKLEVCGVKAEFTMLFNKNLEECSDTQCKIIWLGKERLCDKNVYVALKTLLMAGICKDLDRAQACRDLFMEIVKIPQQNITDRSMLTYALVPKGVYMYDTIVQAVTEKVFTEKEVVSTKILRVLLNDGVNVNFAYEIADKYNLDTVEKYDDFIKTNYEKIRSKTEKKSSLRGIPKDVLVLRECCKDE